MPYEIHFLSWTGALLLALCAVPQAIKAKRDPSSTRGLSWLFLWTWLGGEALTLLGLSQAVSFPVLANYALNMFVISYLLWVKMEQK
jgi:PQ loop repeat protein